MPRQAGLSFFSIGAFFLVLSGNVSVRPLGESPSAWDRSEQLGDGLVRSSPDFAVRVHRGSGSR
jgi:hypothetical protein